MTQPYEQYNPTNPGEADQTNRPAANYPSTSDYEQQRSAYQPGSHEPLPPTVHQFGFPLEGQPTDYRRRTNVADNKPLTRKWAAALGSRSPEYFNHEMVNATWNQVNSGVVIWGIVAAAALVVVRLLLIAKIGDELDVTVRNTAVFTSCSSLVGGIVGVFAVFFLGAGLTYLFGKVVFGGKVGDFRQSSYLISLTGVPLGIINSVLGAVMTIVYLFTVNLETGEGAGFLITISRVIPILFWLAVGYYLHLAMQAAFSLSRKEAIYATLAVVLLPTSYVIAAFLGFDPLADFLGQQLVRSLN